MQLGEQRTVEAMRQAIAKFEEAVPLFRAAGDRNMAATTLKNIGIMYYALGEKQTALNYYNQALPLYQAISHHPSEAETLENIGAVYFDLGENQKALDFFNQALQLFRQLHSPSGEAEALYRIGYVYDKLWESPKALDSFNQALKIFQQLNNQPEQAKTLDSIGDTYFRLGENQKALEAYNQALQLFQVLNNQAGAADTLSGIASVYSRSSEHQKALTAHNQALQIYQTLNNRDREARTLIDIGEVYVKLGETQKAFDAFNRVLDVSKAMKDLTGEARALSKIGNLYQQLGDYLKAVEYLNRVLQLVRTDNNQEGEFATLGNLGQVYGRLGEYQKALNLFNQALALSRTSENKLNTALTLFAIAQVYRDLGNEQQALNFLNQALSLFRAIEAREQEAWMLVMMGDIYRSLDEYEQAINSYKQALPIQRALGNRAMEAMALSLMANVYSDMGESQQALDYSDRALQVARAAGEPRYEGMALVVRADFFHRLGEYRKALEDSQQALQLFRSVGDSSQETETLGSIAKAHLQLREYQQALNNLSQGLRLAKDRGERSKEAELLYGIAKVERERDNLNEAKTQIEAAIEILEFLRTKVASQELRSSYFASKQDYYKFYIDLLMQLHKTNPSKGYNAEALYASERARARNLLEILTEAHADIRRGADPKLVEQERTLQQQLNAKEYRKYQLLQGQYTDQELADIQKDIETLLSQLNDVQAQIRVKSPSYAAITQPQAFTLNLQQIQQQVLDDNTLLLEYSLGEERSYLWAVTKTGITSYELPKGADIEAAAKEFYNQLKSEAASNLEAGMKLSQMLLAPVASQLGQKRLVIVSDGALQSIPFAALPIPDGTSPPAPLLVGEGSNPAPPSHPFGEASYAGKGAGGLGFTPLLVQHEIVSLPSASTIALLRREVKDRPLAAKTLAVLANPVFSRDDPRFKTAQQPRQNTTSPTTDPTRSSLFTEPAETYDTLPNTLTEAQQILQFVPDPTQRLQAIDFAASRATATSPDLAQYRMIHFATHGSANEEHPEFSKVVLSLVDEKGADINGFLHLQDIFNLNLPAELVVLSACQTGLGKDVKGEGLVSLTRGFMYAGSKRVVVSLWRVKDRSTAELMTNFYQQMLQQGLNPVAALRAAQLKMLQSEHWKSPYYWAPFIIQGEWQ
ncbi:MAG: CHAT domain-containing protein [Coleofasciculaceae cyanobacterium]